jgi:hypothetical protein
LAQVLLGFANAPDNTYSGPLYGNCVGAEEFTAKAADGHLGTDAEAIAASRAWGTLNGGDLATILDEAASTPYQVGGQMLLDGPKQTVNYLDWSALTGAIVDGQVKIAIAANQTESAGAGEGRVWFMLSANYDNGIDHCVGLAGFGSLADCCAELKVPVPSGADSTQLCVVMEEWADGDTTVVGSGGYGIVSYPALLAVMSSTPTAGNSEAWLRVPTTVIPNPPVPVPNPPTPSPTPTRRAIAIAAELAARYATGNQGDVLAELSRLEAILGLGK